MNKTTNPANQIIESAAMLKLHQQQKIQQQLQRTPEKQDNRSVSDMSCDTGSRLLNGDTPFKVNNKSFQSVSLLHCRLNNLYHNTLNFFIFYRDQIFFFKCFFSFKYYMFFSILVFSLSLF